MAAVYVVIRWSNIQPSQPRVTAPCDPHTWLPLWRRRSLHHQLVSRCLFYILHQVHQPLGEWSLFRSCLLNVREENHATLTKRSNKKYWWKNLQHPTWTYQEQFSQHDCVFSHVNQNHLYCLLFFFLKIINALIKKKKKLCLQLG